eukprot:Tbor_TRINITY_DN3960_c0_g1::TRINITY_DN3960_c0_g1_i1::g.746::m.746
MLNYWRLWRGRPFLQGTRASDVNKKWNIRKQICMTIQQELAQTTTLGLKGMCSTCVICLGLPSLWGPRHPLLLLLFVLLSYLRDVKKRSHYHKQPFLRRSKRGVHNINQRYFFLNLTQKTRAEIIFPVTFFLKKK